MALTNAQYDELRREYDARQSLHRRTAEERKKEIYGKNPRLSEIDAELAHLAVEKTERLLSGDEGALSSMHLETERLRKEKAEIFRELGVTEEYFRPSYICPDCRDTGFIDGKPCHCFRQAAINLVYTQSNLTEVLKEENFDHFSLDYYSRDEKKRSTGGNTPYDQAKLAVGICYDFIETFDTEFRNLFFYGNTGIGKTFLSNCVAKALLDQGHSVVYFTAQQLFDIFEKDVFGKDISAKAMRTNIYEAELLIVDDLGTETGNSFTSSQLYLTVNERILRKRSTIISTNLQISDIADEYSERTFSRISSYYTVIRLFGDDIRLVKKFQAGN